MMGEEDDIMSTKLSRRKLWAYPVGSIGRDMAVGMVPAPARQAEPEEYWKRVFAFLGKYVNSIAK